MSFCHNIRRYDEQPTLVMEPAPQFPHPVFHTNNVTWWSSLRQDWADDMKVMWTRSGYTKPFFDHGVHGGTDMAYFVRVGTAEEGRALAANLSTALFQYIFKTAKWSGFGKTSVFSRGFRLCQPTGVMSDYEMFDHFGLSEEEVTYVRASLAPRRRKNG
jgi:hypothetical protein